MERLCKMLLVVFVLLFFVPTAYAMCFIQDVECLAPKLLGDQYSKDPQSSQFDKEWSASYGRVFSISRGLVFAFRFDQEAISILRSNELFAIEFDFIVRGGNRSSIIPDGVVVSSNLNGAQVGYDTEALDNITNDGDTRTIGTHILKPQLLQAGELYMIIIKTKNDLPNSDILFTPSIQLTLNVADYARLSTFFGSAGFLANEIIDFYDQFKQDKYFVLETDPFDNAFVPGEGCQVAWDDHVSNRKQCNSDTIPVTFTDGNTTHIIHPNYRCSNNQCWQPGGETNCWDGNSWYEISNGNVSNISRYRDRSMCAEVYNSGTPSTSGSSQGGHDPGSGDGYNDTTDNTPIKNSHDTGGSDLSISSCYVSIYTEDKWKHTLTKNLYPNQSFYRKITYFTKHHKSQYMTNAKNPVFMHQLIFTLFSLNIQLI